MNVFNLVLALTLVTALAAEVPVAYPAARDGEIEFSAKTSFNFRMVLRSQVRIRASDGVVTLTGRVEDQTTRSLAAETVENYPGVKAVINDITVSPRLNEFSDGWIAQHVHLRLLVKTGTNPESLRISVSDGVVLLRGTAETARQSELTTAYAREIVGVSSVMNELVVTHRPTERRQWDGPIDDSSITAQLQHAIRECPGVDATTISIITQEGRISITGTARNQTEKARITELGRQVRGSVHVDNQMDVPS